MAKSVFELFQNTVASRRDKVAAQIKVHGAWRDITWGEMDRVARNISAGLVAAIVTLPLAMGLGILAFAPLGPQYVSAGVIAGLYAAARFTG